LLVCRRREFAAANRTCSALAVTLTGGAFEIGKRTRCKERKVSRGNLHESLLEVAILDELQNHVNRNLESAFSDSEGNADIFTSRGRYESGAFEINRERMPQPHDYLSLCVMLLG
jgi:hypothetical protein